jgi:hypothetical protein
VCSFTTTIPIIVATSIVSKLLITSIPFVLQTAISTILAISVYTILASTIITIPTTFATPCIPSFHAMCNGAAFTSR